MIDHQFTKDIFLIPADNCRLANLCGQFDEHLRLIERRLKVEISSRGNFFQISGAPAAVQIGENVLLSLFEMTNKDHLDTERVHMILQESFMDGAELPLNIDKISSEAGKGNGISVIETPKRLIRPRGANQISYVKKINDHDLAFGIGPAGTGKTYLAIASAVSALEREQVRRIVLVRPAVEAGERLGFLPGDLAQKVDPYLRPMYDALYEMIGSDRVMQLIEKNVIEVAPLAFMRGRSLNESIVILDEAQNTSIEQMKMFLTRIGFGSRAIVTGDLTQIDLPSGQISGLQNATEVLKKVEGVAFTFFSSKDVVRHEIVRRVFEAYEKYESSN